MGSEVMKLYHGTSESAAKVALVEGLIPRGWRGASSVWEGCPSHPDCVYLTTAYAGYFAMNATPHKERWAIMEIDTDQLPQEAILVPDEDFLEQATRGHPKPADWGFPEDASMEERTAWFREHLFSFSHLWKDSVKHLGNCAVLGMVPSTAVSRVAFYDPDSNPGMTMLTMHPMISMMNYRVCGPKYRGVVRWLMGDDVLLSDIDPFALETAGPETPPGLEDFFAVTQRELSS